LADTTDRPPAISRLLVQTPISESGRTDPQTWQVQVREDGSSGDRGSDGFGSTDTASSLPLRDRWEWHL